METKENISDMVVNIGGVDYVPLPKINQFCPYSYPRVRGLIHENKIPREKLKRYCNLMLIQVDFIPMLTMMANDPEKYKQQQHQIAEYYRANEQKQKKGQKQTVMM